jgi:hypothetical protein
MNDSETGETRNYKMFITKTCAFTQFLKEHFKKSGRTRKIFRQPMLYNTERT